MQLPAAPIEACLNGAREPREHAALPVTAEQLAADARACAALGAHLVHVHPRDGAGRETLEPAVVDATARAVRDASGALVSVSTAAWIEPDPAARVAAVRRWRAPDLASVNLREPGALETMRALLDAGIAVEAGVWDHGDAQRLLDSGLAGLVAIVLVEIVERDPARAVAEAEAVDALLDAGAVHAPRVHHGEDAATWAVLRRAAALGHGLRVGLEDTLTGPDGGPAAGNPELVRAVTALASAARRGAL